MQLSISEILNKVKTFKKKSEKIDWLRSNESAPLRTILRLMYDERVEFLLPSSPPPWKKNSYVGVEGMLYNEARRLKIFVKGGGYDNINQTKRESLFISLLEDIDNGDADLLANNLISQKPVVGIPKKLLEEAFPDLFTAPIKI